MGEEILMELELKVKAFTNKIDKITEFEIGDWIDLRCAVDVDLRKGEAMLIPLGVGIILPDGYEAHIVPRSSTFLKYGIIQTNSTGIVDNSYSGDEDEWKFPVLAVDDTFIPQNTRICQFRIMERQPKFKITYVRSLNPVSRGGFGKGTANKA